MPKIAIACSGLGHVHRGIETWAKNLAYALRERGVPVTLFKGGGYEEPKIEKRLFCIARDSWILGGKNSEIPWFYRYFIEQITFSFSLILKLRKGYDIVHLADSQVASMLVRANRMGLIKTKVILATSLNIKDISNPPRWPNVFEHLQLFTPYYLKRAREAGFDTREWFVIPHFVDIEKFTPGDSSDLRESLKIPEDAFVVLSVGAIQKSIKRMDYVIKEVAKLDDAYLIIAGEEEKETEDLLKLGKDLMDDRISFMENVPNEDMPQIYSSADVFVLGSIVEQFGIVFLEAMASELPVVAHTAPIAKWIVGDGGECIDMPKNGELLKILKKYRGKSCRKKNGENARKRVEKTFSKKIVIENIMKMYGEVHKG